MNLIRLTPKMALNKAFLKVKPSRLDIEYFKSNLISLLDSINLHESEEFHKNLISNFLKQTYYKNDHFINTKNRNDLVIHIGPKADSHVGVIIETKKPTNTSEMMTTKTLNVKAFHELVLYYLRERITHNNLEVKQLIATNINEWFIFDVVLFERLFAQNKSFVKQFVDFEEGRLADTRTDFFYKQIAKPFIDSLETDIEFTYFNFADYQKMLRNKDKSDDNKLIALFKLLSPEHFLKLPFNNDSNTLDKRFYSEFLYIIGLTETKEKSKRVIGRNKPGERHSGTILEDTIIQIDSLDKLSRLDNLGKYGNSKEERLFNVALELAITWINRILFLKLLEAQLLAYHKGDKSYHFLKHDRVRNYDDLNSLFFQVLARTKAERNDDVRNIYEKVPYLNSSLFEPTELEHIIFSVGNLKDDKTIPIFSQTVLKDQNGKKRSGKLVTLEYLFEFLNSYDFSSEGSEEIQEESKTLINASVLGLIFEKINGYKDGSFFTPGYITMYMCRETIRKAVIQKFNDVKNWNCLSLNEVYDKIKDRNEANIIVNSLKICDPAVGSGHFLVSALNEMIAIKNDLKILQDREGKRLKEYHVEVVNDELIVTDEDGELFEYNPKDKESQRIQEALFHEKQTLIENCLFGVDINTNSVKICRLRLWIELLKNAYYKNTHELETLPNIDINIKCGNSLVSRFPIDSDLKQALKESKWTIESYRVAVATYRNAETKEQKREMERLIGDIKSNFRSEISSNDPIHKKRKRLKVELNDMTQQMRLFDMNQKEKSEYNKNVQKLSKQIEQIEGEIAEIKSNVIFESAFEWRFEFPEVLDRDGHFIGFDVVIGNPPYGVKLSDNEKEYITQTIFNSTETAILFVHRGKSLLNHKGKQSYIIPKSFTYASNYLEIRNFVLSDLSMIVDCHKPWQDVKIEACIFQVENNTASKAYQSLKVDQKNFVKLTDTSKTLVDEFGFLLNGVTDREIQLALKIKSGNPTFDELKVMNKRGVGVQNQLKSNGLHSVIGGIDLERTVLKGSISGYLDDLSKIDPEGFVHKNTVLVQNIVAHIKNPNDHIKIIAAIPDGPQLQHVILDTINQIAFPEDISKQFGCAFLNSKIVNWFVYNFIFARAIRTMHFDSVVTDRICFPIKYFADKQVIDDKASDLSDHDFYQLFGLNESEISLIQ